MLLVRGCAVVRAVLVDLRERVGVVECVRSSRVQKLVGSVTSVWVGAHGFAKEFSVVRAGLVYIGNGVRLLFPLNQYLGRARAVVHCSLSGRVCLCVSPS
jgi:hypothetical protein